MAIDRYQHIFDMASSAISDEKAEGEITFSPDEEKGQFTLKVSISNMLTGVRCAGAIAKRFAGNAVPVKKIEIIEDTFGVVLTLVGVANVVRSL